jgi:hypothetical protein
MSAVLDGATQIILPTNLLAIVALGLLAGQSAARRPGVILALFTAGLVTGAILIASALRDPPAADVLLALAAITGVTIAIGFLLPRLIHLALAFATGAALALNAPPQAVTVSAAVVGQLGTIFAALAVTSLIAFVASKAEDGWQRIGVRIVGSWIAASAILVLALHLAR